MFDREIDALQGDGFEGVNDELRISQEVFYGSEVTASYSKCAVSGETNFRNEPNKFVETSLCSNSYNSAITSQVSSRDQCLEDADNTNSEFQDASGSPCFTEGLTEGGNTDHVSNAKRAKLSVDELSNFKPYLEKAQASSVPLKQVVSGMYYPTFDSGCRVLMCHVVESSKEGLTSSCYLLKQRAELNREGNAEDGNFAKGSFPRPGGSEGKTAGGSTAIASPISQESSASKILVASPSSTAVIESGLPQCAEKKPRKAFSPVLQEDDVFLASDSTKDPRVILRPRVFHLFKEAGWTVGRRKRKCRTYPEFVYLTPEGRTIREFPRAWRVFGQSLCAHRVKWMQENDRCWNDINDFLSDLSETLKNIGNDMKDWEHWSRLAHQWNLLDPFVTIVFVDRRIHELKSGNAVKPKRTVVIEMGRKPVVGFATHRKSDKKGSASQQANAHSSMTSGSFVIDFGGQSTGGTAEPKSRSVHLSGGNSMHLVEANNEIGNQYEGMSSDESRYLYSSHLPVWGSDTNCFPLTNSLYDVPVAIGDADMIPGRRLTFSPHHDSCISYPSCSKQNSEPGDKMTKDVAVCSFEGGEETFERAVVHAGVNSKRKMHKKSKRNFKVKSSQLCEDEEIFLCTGYLAEPDVLETDSHSSQAMLAQAEVHSAVHAENCDSQNKLPVSSLQHPSGLMKARLRNSSLGGDHSSDCLQELSFGNDMEYSGYKSCMKDARLRKPVSGKERSITCQLKDDDLLISAILRKKSFKTRGRPAGKGKLRKPKRRKNQGSCRLLPRNMGKGGKHFNDGRGLWEGSRTVLSWLINVGVVFVNETLQYRDPKNGSVVKDGLITREGILCKCCNKQISVSEFKVHAGYKQSRPCLNLFAGSGKPYTLCQLQAWSDEYKARKSVTRTIQIEEFDENDDSCGLCGDGGELLCCDYCPSTFHQSCLVAEEVPDGNWYCSNCTCRICGDLVNEKEPSNSDLPLKCPQCERKYHQKCAEGNGLGAGDISLWFCGAGCEEVYSDLQSHVGLSNVIADGFSWTLLRCIHDDQRVPSSQHFAQKAEFNSKLAVALTIMEECFASMVDPRTGIDMIPQVVYNWGSDFARLNYYGFYTAVLEKDDVLISVASIRVHGVSVAEMPLVATCSKYRRQGMCRRLLSSIEKMLISLKVEKLVVAAIPDLIETWTMGFGFVPVEEDEKQRLKNTNLMVFPGTVLLKKTLYVSQPTDLQQGAGDTSPLKADKPCKEKVCVNDADPESMVEVHTEATLTMKAKPVIGERDSLQIIEDQIGSPRADNALEFEPINHVKLHESKIHSSQEGEEDSKDRMVDEVGVGPIDGAMDMEIKFSEDPERQEENSEMKLLEKSKKPCCNEPDMVTVGASQLEPVSDKETESVYDADEQFPLMEQSQNACDFCQSE